MASELGGMRGADADATLHFLPIAMSIASVFKDGVPSLHSQRRSSQRSLSRWDYF